MHYTQEKTRDKRTKTLRTELMDNLPSVFNVNSVTNSSMTSVSGILATVVLPVVAVWTMGFFLIVLITVAKAGSRRLTKNQAY